MKSLVLVPITLMMNFSIAWGYNILMLCPPPAKSHHNLCTGIADILGDGGHNVTFVSAFPKENSKHREIGVPEMLKTKDFMSQSIMTFSKLSKFDTIKFISSWQQSVAEVFFSNKDVKKLMTDPNEKFDLVVYEYFMNEYMTGFSVHFECPCMVLSPVPLMSWLAVMTGNPLSIATIPNVFSQLTPKMNLFERTVNTIFAIVQDLAGIFFVTPISKSLYEQYFPVESEKVPHEELKNLISGTFITGHPVLSGARPLLPNSIEIGGFHVRDPEPLPKDLKKILDDSKDGAIFFSMGSNLNSSDLSPELLNSFLAAISSVKQTVLWKFEKDLPEKPKNLYIRKWMPQTGILAHPNLKLFISHGGLLSLIEATKLGVPLMIIPVLGDQHHNAIGVESRSQGIFVQFDNVTETSLKWGLTEMLNNKKYLENCKRLQKLFLDRPVTPHDSVNYLARHVIETGGAAHLSPNKLPRSSQLLLDVAAVILIPLGLIIYLLISCCKWCSGSSKSKLSKPQPKKIQNKKKTN